MDMQADLPRSKRVALALSGGGFRATLFHLGVLLYLRDSGGLAKVTHISSVSGGSITAAFVLANWNSFLDAEAHFGIVRRLVAFTQSDVLGEISQDSGSKTEALEASYKDRLFSEAKLSSLQGESRPELYVMATNLTTGDPVAFATDGLYLKLPTKQGEAIAFDFSLARAVAASSAFPVIFDPVEITREELALTATEMPPLWIKVTDGGVRDNSGLEFLVELQRSQTNAPFTCLISSDARRCFNQSEAGEETTFGFKLPTIIDRAFEIATIQLDNYREQEAKPKFVRLTDPAHESSIVGAEVARHLRFMRTDLGKFTDAEVFALVGHGYYVACKCLAPLFAPTGIAVPRDWDRTLGKPASPISAGDFKDSRRVPIARHAARPMRLVAGAVLMLLMLALGLSLWYWLSASPILPVYDSATFQSVHAADVREKWITAILNDLRREGRREVGDHRSCGAGRLGEACMLTEVVRGKPFDRPSASGSLIGTFNDNSFEVRGLAFLSSPTSEGQSYVALPLVSSEGRIAISYARAKPNDELVLALLLIAREGGNPPESTGSVFTTWRFE